MSEHRVAGHLGVAAEDYDRQIRRFIPHYEEMIGEVVALLDAVLPEDAVVVDLGAGTGALAGAILAAVPRARALLVDVDPAMLAVARARLERFAGRFEVRRARFDDPLPPSDAVVASLALHHVPEVAAKRALYAQLRSSLRPGGVLVSADCTVHAAGPEHDRAFQRWTAGMFDAGIGPGEAEALFAQWSREDTYLPLATELALLADAGFARPECFWRRGAMTVFGGFT